MDYSIKGILTLLQDLQRIHFGKMTIHVHSYLLESGPMVCGCVFDENGEPHSYNFYSFDNEEKHKEDYKMFLSIINNYGKDGKEGHREAIQEDK